MVERTGVAYLRRIQSLYKGIEGFWDLLRQVRRYIFCFCLKSRRLFDLTIAIFVLIFLSPLLVVIGVLTYFSLGCPVLFRQLRPGLGGRPFNIYKFRTMTEARDRHGRFLPDDKRLARFGRFLRGTSLDELPELFNVIKGDMSIVGPRPLLMQYLDRYSREQERRHEVKPGITGWAQVNGRNVIAWDQKFEYDVWYVDHQSFWLDLKIIGLTIWKILKREGISQPGQATAEEFMGGNSRKKAQKAQIVLYDERKGRYI